MSHEYDSSNIYVYFSAYINKRGVHMMSEAYTSNLGYNFILNRLKLMLFKKEA